MDVSFIGKRALVTGGGRGIGREIAKYLVISGAKTIVLTKSDSSVANLKEEDPEIEVLQVDLTDWDSTRSAVQSVLPIDLLVNNAGVEFRKPFVDCDRKDIAAVFSVHYAAVFNISQIVCTDLIGRGKPGSIVNISAVSSKKCLPLFSVAGSCKAALDSLTKYMAFEMGPKQIRVNAVNPGLIKTDMIMSLLDNPDSREKVDAVLPVRTAGEKCELAEVVLFLLSDRASLINGVTLTTDRGAIL